MDDGSNIDYSRRTIDYDAIRPANIVRGLALPVLLFFATLSLIGERFYLGGKLEDLADRNGNDNGVCEWHELRAEKEKMYERFGITPDPQFGDGCLLDFDNGQMRRHIAESE